MLIKFERQSGRVKGLSFHPKRPWILASLHTGSIFLYDYQLNTCLDKFEGHDGPVRGIQFHNDQPIFVSGGDDYRIKVWNYQQHRCLFTLSGHMDYIRSTFFHPKHPWIVSASDDQTVRIWNWQSRCRIALLTGHNHYVMSAQFHPSEDLVVSASLDQTIRVWDISSVTKRHMSAQFPSKNQDSSLGGINVDLFREAVVTKYILEGHDKGVNWATFHPTLPLILSGGDDRHIKLWRMGEQKVWEVDTFRGHYNNVSIVMFHPREPIVISASEDKSLRVWDMTRRTSLQIFRRSHDRFWTAAAHPTQNLFCAGHDSGLLMFKLERERPVWALQQNILFYIKERYLRRSDLNTGQDLSIMRLRGEGRTNYATMSYNAAENSILLNNHDSAYELYEIPVQKDISLPPDSPRDWKKSSGRSACWLGRNRFAVLLNETHIHIKTSKNELYKKIQVPFNCLNLFPAGAGMLLIQQQPSHLDAEKAGASNIVLYDVQRKHAVAKVRTICKIKHVVWSSDGTRLALLGKSAIMLCNKRLEIYASWFESGKVKSGAWRQPFSEVGVFIYNTSAHLKYAFTNGDTGTIRALDVPIYVVTVNDDLIVCFDREGKLRRFKVDTTEILFKLGLISGNYTQILEMVRNCKLVGQAIISYIHRKGYPEIALHFLQQHDQRTRFNLALECCNVDVALECARVLDTAVVWNKLAETALLLGKHQTVELCYQRTRNVAKLAFLYLILGNSEKLKKLMKSSTAQGQYWMALVSGDVESQIKVLRNSSGGKLLMAYEMAAGSQLAEAANEIRSAMTPELAQQIAKFESCGKKHHLLPPKPLCNQRENWPLLMTSKSVFGSTPSSSLFKSKSHDDDQMLDSECSGGWTDGEEFSEVLDDDDQGEMELSTTDVGVGDGWDDQADIVLPSTSSTNLTDMNTDDGFFVPARGNSVPKQWSNSYQLPIVHVLSGNFESAARLLHEQLGVVNITPFRQLFLNAYLKSYLVYTPLPNSPGLSMYPVAAVSGKKEQIPLPQTVGPQDLDVLVTKKLKGCYEMVTKGQFKEATDAYRNLLLSVPLVVAQSKAEITKAHELISLCKEYILGLQMEMYRKTFSKETVQDHKRSLELAAYFTHFSLDHIHLMLALRTAMNLSYKLGYFKNASSFARRLLELGPSGELAVQARKLVKASVDKNNSSLVELEYDEQNPFSVCAKTYKPIYRGKPEIKCPFCGAAYMPEFAGKLCDVCTVAEIGKQVLGLRLNQFQFR